MKPKVKGKDRPQNKNLVSPKKGQRFGGRAKGTENKFSRDIKEAIITAASLSKHSKTDDLLGYMVYLADDKQELYVTLLGRLIPLQHTGKMEVEHVIKAKPETQMTPQELSDYYAKLRMRPASTRPLLIDNDTGEPVQDVSSYSEAAE